MLSRSVLAALAALPFLSVPAHAQAELAGQVDLLEMHVGKGDDHFLFDSTFTLSGERHGVALKLEGGSDVGAHIDEVTAQMLYRYSPSGNTNILLGARNDFRSGSDLSHATLGVEVQLTSAISGEHYLWLSEDGDITGAAMVVGTLSLGEELWLEPRVAVGWSARAIPAEDVGAGIGELELPARLRRQIGPLFNVYGGIIDERLVGDTRDIARTQGDNGHVTRAVIGLGLNF